MIQKGQVAIFTMVQAESFNKEIKHLISKTVVVSSNSIISQLDPLLDGDNIIRFGRRLRKSSLTEAVQHPFFEEKLQCLM